MIPFSLHVMDLGRRPIPATRELSYRRLVLLCPSHGVYGHIKVWRTPGLKVRAGYLLSGKSPAQRESPSKGRGRTMFYAGTSSAS